MDFSHLPYRPNVGIVLINDQSHIFAGQRFDHSAEAWQMPQGGIDDGENPHTAALRELEEETGVPPELVTIIGETPDWLYYDLPDELIPKLWNGAFRGQKQKWFLMRFLGNDDQINIATDIPEFSQWTWMAQDQLLNSIVPFKRGVYEGVLTAFEGHFG